MKTNAVETKNDSSEIVSPHCELLLLQLSTLVKEIALASGQFVMMTTFPRAAGKLRDLGTFPHHILEDYLTLFQSGNRGRLCPL